MDLTVGKKYLDRYDNEWRVVHQDPGFTYPFVAVLTKLAKPGSDPQREETYSRDGRWSHYCPAACDLIREA